MASRSVLGGCLGISIGVFLCLVVVGTHESHPRLESAVSRTPRASIMRSSGMRYRRSSCPEGRITRVRPIRAQEEESQEGEASNVKDDKNRFSWAGVRQLVSMGLGTMAGDIKEINLKDPKRTVVLELEANNFEDADGNPLSGKYRDKGWVDKSGEAEPMGGKIAVGLIGVASIGLVGVTLKALSSM
ncbi:hypothetical protein AAMO2058_001612400 [Amorphochlora amoebiformis]